MHRKLFLPYYFTFTLLISDSSSTHPISTSKGSPLILHVRDREYENNKTWEVQRTVPACLLDADSLYEKHRKVPTHAPIFGVTRGTGVGCLIRVLNSSSLFSVISFQVARRKGQGVNDKGGQSHTYVTLVQRKRRN